MMFMTLLRLWGACFTWRWRWAALGILWCAGAAHAQTTNLVVAHAWAEDPTGALQFADRHRLSLQSFRGALTRGYGPGVIWLQLQIDPALARVDEDVVLRIRPAYLDQIQVFDTLAVPPLVGVLGDTVHPRHSELSGSDFLLPLARGTAPREVWLRLSSTSTRQIHVSVLPQHQLRMALAKQDFVFSLYIGLVFLIAIWAAVNAGVQRDTLMLSFSVHQFAAVLYGLASLGYIRLYWPHGWSASNLDVMSSYASIVAVGTGLAFHALFLKSFQPAAWAYRALLALLGVSVLSLAALAFGIVRPLLQLNIWVLLLSPMVTFWCAWTAQVWRTPHAASQQVLPRNVVLVFYGLIFLLLIAAATTALAFFPASLWTLYISQVHGLIAGLLLLLMLQYRTHRMTLVKQGSEIALQRATLQAKHEHDLRLEHERLLAMLAHEIKTPLATMHMLLGGAATPEVRQALRDMNSVIERCIQASQTEEGRLRVSAELLDVSDVVQDAVSSCSAPDRIALTLPTPGSLPRVRTDRQLLFIVMANLLDNACKYAPDSSRIDLAVRASTESPGHVDVRLANLPGNADWPDPSQVFQKYYRAPHAQRLAGTGLGLYIVRSVVQTLGGRIAYTPSDTHVCFVVQLPTD